MRIRPKNKKNNINFILFSLIFFGFIYVLFLTLIYNAYPNLHDVLQNSLDISYLTITGGVFILLTLFLMKFRKKI